MMRLLCLVLLLPLLAFAEPVTMTFDSIKLPDLARIVYGDMLKQSYVFDADLINSSEEISVNWLHLSEKQVSDLTHDIFKSRGYLFEQEGNILHIRKGNVDDQQLLLYKPRYRPARYLSDIVAKVADAHQLGSRGFSGTPDFQAAMLKQQEVPGAASSYIDRSALDQLAYMCVPAECDRLRNLFNDLDTPEAQVLLRAAVYEVGTTQGQGSAIQIAAKILGGKIAASVGDGITATSQFHLITGSLDAAISILDQDSRFKVVSRPLLRVRTGAQATFSVGQQVPVLGTVSQDKNGNAVQSVEYRQSGTIFTVQPDVRVDVVDLTVTQELSSFVATTTGVNNSPTLLQRTASSQLSIKPGEVVVFAGLEEQRDDDTQSSIFGFHLNKNKNNATSEVLLFIEAQLI